MFFVFGSESKYYLDYVWAHLSPHLQRQAAGVQGSDG